MIKKIFSDRNMLLVLALVLGLVIPEIANYFKPYLMYVLAFVMTLSLSGIASKALLPLKRIVKPMIKGILFNHVLFGLLTIISAYFFNYDQYLFVGMIVIAATPPGIAIIPFTYKLKGNVELSAMGTFGAFMASVFLAPLVLNFFGKNIEVDSFKILKSMVLLIVIPFIVSRFLLLDKIQKPVAKYRGMFIDISFAIIIYTSVGLNAELFFNDFYTILKLSICFLLIVLIIPEVLGNVLKSFISYKDAISVKLLFSIKSAGFAIVTALELFGKQAAVPSTVFSIIILVYLLYLLLLKKK